MSLRKSNSEHSEFSQDPTNQYESYMSTVRFPKGAWVVRPSMRMPLPDMSTLSLAQRAVVRYSQHKAKSDSPLNVFTVLARLGDIFVPYALFMSRLLMKGRLSRTDKELVVLHVAWRLGCVYEWVHHSHLAAELGITEEQIQSMGQAGSPLWDNRVTSLLAAADELLDKRQLSDTTWKNLRALLNENQIVEFCFLVGHYQMVAMTINTMGIAPEPEFMGKTKLPQGQGDVPELAEVR